MRGQEGRVFSIAASHAPVPGCTTSAQVAHGEGFELTHFALAAGTDISAESHPGAKLLLVDGGEMLVALDRTQEIRAQAGQAILVPSNVLVGLASPTGCVFTDLTCEEETTMNEALKAGDVLRLADLLPYQEGTIVNMDLAHNKGMKFALMSFDAGTGLSEHSAPGDALVFALEGEGVIGYEGKEHVIHAGENFKFAAGGRHFVRADKRFKMALLLTLE